MDSGNYGSSGSMDSKESVRERDLSDAATGDSSLILPSQIIPIQVERIRNMLHGLSRPNVILYQDDIKAASAISNTMLCKILRGQLDQFGSLARIDRLDRAPECPCSPPFDLDEYQDALVIGDQIEFAQRRPHIAAENAEPPLPQVGLGSSLAFISYRPACVAHREASTVTGDQQPVEVPTRCLKGDAAREQRYSDELYRDRAVGADEDAPGCYTLYGRQNCTGGTNDDTRSSIDRASPWQ
jgi:hypothetical protein